MTDPMRVRIACGFVWFRIVLLLKYGMRSKMQPKLIYITIWGFVLAIFVTDLFLPEQWRLNPRIFAYCGILLHATTIMIRKYGTELTAAPRTRLTMNWRCPQCKRHLSADANWCPKCNAAITPIAD